jgi:hypothetical protein
MPNRRQAAIEMRSCSVTCNHLYLLLLVSSKTEASDFWPLRISIRITHIARMKILELTSIDLGGNYAYRDPVSCADLGALHQPVL